MLKTIAVAVFLGQAASAGEWVLGIGGDDLLDKEGRESIAFLFEYHTEPFYEGRILNLSLMGMVQVDKDNDTFAGFGVHNRTNFGQQQRYFWEASLAVGHYDVGGTSTDHHDGTLFRSSLGLGVHLSDRDRLSVTLDHLLDLDMKNKRTGSETIMLRYGVDF